MASNPLTIGIDARLYGLEHAGIGRYVMNLVDRVIKNDRITWTLFVNTKYKNHFPHQENLRVIPTDIRHYSFSEQTDFLKVLLKEKLHLLHVPHFNVPMLYKRPFVVTIHDILWHQVRGGQVTTLSPIKYYAKYLGYRLTVRSAVFNAKAVVVPSEYVKSDLKRTFPKLNTSKIHVTYEGITPLSSPENSHINYGPYLLYVGSAYPHKNISVLLQALRLVRDQSIPNLKLILISSRSIFLESLKKEIKKLKLEDAVICAGYKKDEEMASLMKNALCLVHPSKSEGFGLTGLEAMANGLPVIAAESTALPEIYSDAALFFKPDNPAELAKNITTLVTDHRLREHLITYGKQHASQFSWDKMTDQTVNIYKKILNQLETRSLKLET